MHIMLTISSCDRFHTENISSIEVPEGLSNSEAIAHRGKLMGELWQALPEEEKKVCRALLCKCEFY